MFIILLIAGARSSEMGQRQALGVQGGGGQETGVGTVLDEVDEG